ncbi:MarR family winged helix-turn-helix transcriptional regulator [Paenactinomyces guangxiensis]|uniref:MarR family transcriptional regulator n=1 Tax=Paenactinomyces guangxiensis TaxID=1490290 RepID=A0A7W2A886_9BACL|nr:MarR family transcriptional regulator [Paenactinomyces guangxiensis]MBA4493909.1 MarR family transcriptional regulator [Paenactinomyces guangxiensis]MBH8591375.1 MarR family transcriptional regulator [Paenactinomyces guangxiensis]
MEKIEQCITFLLGKAYQKSQQVAKQKLNAYQITPVQYALLLVLWEKDGLYSAELGARLKLDGATMTGLLDRLVQKDMIERRPDDTDRRINTIHLTQKAISLKTSLNEAMNQAHEEILLDLSAEEKHVLTKILAKIGEIER